MESPDDGEAQEAPTFQPDHDGDGCYTTEDLTHLLGLYGSCTMGLEDVTVDFHPYSGPDSCFSAFEPERVVPIAIVGTTAT